MFSSAVLIVGYFISVPIKDLFAPFVSFFIYDWLLIENAALARYLLRTASLSNLYLEEKVAFPIKFN